MALAHGAKVATNGLVFAYDMDSPKSFVGSPAVNLLPTTATGTYASLSEANATYGSQALIDTPTPFGSQAHYLTFKTTGSDGYYGTNTCRFISSAITIPRDGTLVAYGVWVHAINNRWADWDGKVYKYVTGSNGMAEFYYSGKNRYDSLRREWRYYHRFATSLTEGGIASNYHAFYKAGALATDLEVLLCAPTMFLSTSTAGLNTHCPLFVNGTRTATESVLDWTGTHQITATSMVYNNDLTFTFNGSTSRLSFNDTPQIRATSASFDVWIKYNAVSTGTRQTAILIGRDINSGICLWEEAGVVSLRLNGAVKASLSAQVNTWVHYGFSYQSGVGGGFYVNGQLFSAISNFGNLTYAEMYPGSPSIGSHGTLYYSNATIPSARVYNRALSGVEIQQNFVAARQRYGI